MNPPSSSFWLYWGLAFLGFPAGGVLSRVAGAVTTPARAIVAGAVAGATLGFVQWFVLKSRLPLLPLWWMVATAVGMSIGLGVSTALLGSETAGNGLLWRAAITGLCIGAAQWIVLQQVLPRSVIWIAVVGLGWVLGWFVTRGVGVDLGPKWSVFGSIGAWAFQLVTGLALRFLLASAPK